MSQTERVVVRPGEEFFKLQLHLDQMARADWVLSLAPWNVIAHLTFRWEVSLDGARRGYERFMKRALPQVSYFYAEERNPQRDGYHVHALWHGNIFRREAWASWFERFGRARIEPIKSRADGVDYCAKYVIKEEAWWNVKLQWDLAQKLRCESFALEREGETHPRPLPVPQSEFGFTRDTFNLYSERVSETNIATPDALVMQADDKNQQSLWRDNGSGVWSRV